MEILEIVFWIVGGILLFLIFAGLQRKFSPETMVNGFMDLNKLKAICPRLFAKCDEKEEQEKKRKIK